MTVTIADLVARFRSDTTDLERGGQVAKQQLQGVEQQAGQTARALEIMSQQFAKLHGGTAQQALDMFQRTGAQPTSAALAQAAQEMERTAAAAAAATAPMQSSARAAVEMRQGMSITASDALRFGASIAGVGLGISLVAGTARVLHDTIAAVVESQTQWERSLIQVRGLYGAIAPQIIATAQAQAGLPGVLGTQQEFVSAALNARYLSSRYGLPQGDITQLTTGAGRVAGALGILDPSARAALQGRFLQFAESGGSGLRDVGIEGDPVAVARRLGFSSEAGLQALTPQQLREAQTLIATEGANRLAATATDQNSLLARRTSVEQQLNQVRDQITRSLEGQAPINSIVTGRLPYIVGQGYDRGMPAPLQNQAATLQQQLDQITTDLGDASKAAADAADKLNKLGVEAGGSAARLLTFTGSIEDRYSIARGDIGAQAQAAVTSRARSAFPARAMSNAEIDAQARGGAAQQVWQNYVAELAQQETANAVRDQLQQIIRTGPGAQRPAAGRALDELDRREQAGRVIGYANRAGDLVNRAGTEGQAQLDSISLRSEERRLAVAEQLADARRQSLEVEGQLAPLLQAQANLQDRMVVAARDNLQSRRELIRAEQAAQGPSNVLSSLDFVQRRLELRAEVSRAAVRRGEGPTEDISDLRQQYRSLELARPDLELRQLDANRAVDVAQQQRTGEQLARDATLTDLEEEGRRLQDMQIPLDQNLRATQAREATIQRTLDLLDLEDTKERTAAQQRLNAAAELKLVTDEIVRQAEDYANGLDLGATAAERSQAALEKARDALKETVPLLNQLSSGASDVSARIANGLGAGGIGPTAGSGGLTIVFSIPPGDQTRIRSEVNAALDQFFAGAATGGAPAAPSLAGAGR